MNIKAITSKEDYEAALSEIEKLMDAEEGSPEDDLLDVLSILVEAYEEEHFPIGFPDPIEAIKYRLEDIGLCNADLEKILKISRGRVWEILNKHRELSKNMIRILHSELKIPYDVLMQPYEIINSKKIA